MQLLMIARRAEGAPMERIAAYVQPGGREILGVLATDMLRSMHYIADMRGVVFLWKAPDHRD